MTNRRTCSLALLVLLALGCGPERGVDAGDPALACLDLPPLGAPILREIAPGPDGERACDDTPDALCFIERTYPIESVWGSVSGDFDGDGFADVVVSHQRGVAGCGGDAYVRLLLGDGEGGFVAGPGFAVPRDQYPELGAADHDGDGADDLFIAAGHRITVHGMQGDAWSLIDSVDFGERRPNHFALGDYDGDGHVDLFVEARERIHPDDPSICPPARSVFLRGDGSGGFGPEITTGRTSSGPSVTVFDERPHTLWTTFLADTSCGQNNSYDDASELHLAPDGTVVERNRMQIAPWGDHLVGTAVDLDQDGTSELLLLVEETLTVFWPLTGDSKVLVDEAPLTSRLARLSSDPDSAYLVGGWRRDWTSSAPTDLHLRPISTSSLEVGVPVFIRFGEGLALRVAVVELNNDGRDHLLQLGSRTDGQTTQLRVNSPRVK